MASETQVVVFHSLKYTAEIMPAIADRAIEGMPARDLAHNLLSNMRTSLSVPCMFAAMRILRRIQSILDAISKNYDDGDLEFELPEMKKCSVNYTVKCIVKDLLKNVGEKFEDRFKFRNCTESNPYRDISVAMDEVIAYVAKKQFGITID